MSYAYLSQWRLKRQSEEECAQFGWASLEKEWRADRREHWNLPHFTIWTVRMIRPSRSRRKRGQPIADPSDVRGENLATDSPFRRQTSSNGTSKCYLLFDGRPASAHLLCIQFLIFSPIEWSVYRLQPYRIGKCNCSNFILAHLPFTYRATHTRQMSQLYRPWSPWLLATHDCRVQSSFVSDWMAIYWKIWLDCCISLYRQNGLVCCFGKALRALCVVCRVRCVMCLNTGSLSDDHHHHSILITVQFIFVIPIFLILLFGFCWGFGSLSLRCHCFTLWYACSLAACATNMAS